MTRLPSSVRAVEALATLRALIFARAWVRWSRMVAVSSGVREKVLMKAGERLTEPPIVAGKYEAGLARPRLVASARSFKSPRGPSKPGGTEAEVGAGDEVGM